MKPIWKRTSGEAFKGNVMTPLNWMTGICTTILVGGGVASQEPWLKITLVVIAIFILLFYARMYRHFALNDPDRLQSEKYNLSQRELTISTKYSAPQIQIDRTKQSEMISSSTIGVLPPHNRQ